MLGFRSYNSAVTWWRSTNQLLRRRWWTSSQDKISRFTKQNSQQIQFSPQSKWSSRTRLRLQTILCTLKEKSQILSNRGEIALAQKTRVIWQKPCTAMRLKNRRENKRKAQERFALQDDWFYIKPNGYPRQALQTSRKSWDDNTMAQTQGRRQKRDKNWFARLDKNIRWLRTVLRRVYKNGIWIRIHVNQFPVPN